MAHRNYWLWVAVIIGLGVLVFFLSFNLPEPKASLVLDFEGQIRKFEGPVYSNTTIVRALFSSSADGSFDVRYFIKENGDVELNSIAGFADIGTKKWNFYLNGRTVLTKDLDRITINPGDTIEGKYK